MLLSNSRIIKNKKINFYEQDILIDDHVYSGNIQVELDIEYINPGVGIALILNEGQSTSNNKETFLFRIGHSEYSIIRSTEASTEIIESGPVINIKPYISNLKFKIRKINNKIQLWIGNEMLSNRYLPAQINNYRIGYYSNAGNSINAISIASEIPDNWVANMSNTSGGYINFSNNSFSISNCSDIAEVEQNKIQMTKSIDGKKYYLRHNISEESDIKSYIFLGDDDRYNDDEKNILLEDGSFTLKEDDMITIKFKGTIGTISNVQLTDSKSDFYIGTDYSTTTTDSSSIQISLLDIDKIEFTGTVYSIPDNQDYSIIQDINNLYTIDDIKIKKDIEYEYAVSINQGLNKSFLIAKNGNEETTHNLSLSDSITIFKNIDAIISKLTLYKKDGSKVEMVGENTKKQYVPASISSPIIVTNEINEPLDLSSSYRKDNERYIFTNVEREVFEPTNRIVLERVPSAKLNTITVYCILKDSDINENDLMNYGDGGIDALFSYANSYEMLDEEHLYSINREDGIIILSDKDDFYINNKYREIVVDYLKEDSYSINYKHEMDSYEVEISTSKNTKTYFDGAVDMDSGFVDVKDYKIFNSVIKNDSYIVVRGGI